MKSIIGTKIGMTQVFDQTGTIVPVTVISAGPCTITNIFTKEKNGYTAIQLGYGEAKEKNATKAFAGIFKKNNIPLKKTLREFRTNDIAEYKIGQEIKVDVFHAGDFVDISGMSKGKGFAGVVKRYRFAGGPSTHGQSDRQRAPGTSGAGGNQRVLKGTKKPGHMGHEFVTIQRLQIIGVDPEKNFLLIKGAVPGTNKGTLLIKNTVKKVKVHHHEAAHKSKKKAPTAPAAKEAKPKK